MKIAYLVNCYPAISHSFIRREIIALEGRGHHIDRYSVRPASASLPDPADESERAITSVVLDQSPAALLLAVIRFSISHPVRMLSAFGRARRMTPNYFRGLVTCVAYLVEACWLARAMERAGTQHIHAHFGTNSTAVARIVHILTDLPYSFTAHGPDEFDAPLALDLGGKIADASFAVAISDFGRSQLCRWANVADWPRIVVVRSGLDATESWRSDAVCDKKFDFCCVARLAPQKGLPILVDAVALLRDRGVIVRLAIVGDGPMRAELVAQATAQNVALQFEWMGSQSGAVVKETMRVSRCMVLPSFAEGLPVVIMEALAVGTPVITTAVAGIPELVDKGCGWVVPAGSAVALANAMVEVVKANSELLNKLGQEGARRVVEDYDVVRNTLYLEELIAKVGHCNG